MNSLDYFDNRLQLYDKIRNEINLNSEGKNFFTRKELEKILFTLQYQKKEITKYIKERQKFLKVLDKKDIAYIS